MAANADVSNDELLAAGAAHGLTMRRLAAWRSAGVLPKPQRKRLGPRRGTRSVSPPVTLRQLRAALRLEPQTQTLGDLRLRLWSEGFYIEPERIRVDALRILDFIVLRAEREEAKNGVIASEEFAAKFVRSAKRTRGGTQLLKLAGSGAQLREAMTTLFAILLREPIERWGEDDSRPEAEVERAFGASPAYSAIPALGVPLARGELGSSLRLTAEYGLLDLRSLSQTLHDMQRDDTGKLQAAYIKELAYAQYDAQTFALLGRLIPYVESRTGDIGLSQLRYLSDSTWWIAFIAAFSVLARRKNLGSGFDELGEAMRRLDKAIGAALDEGERGQLAAAEPPPG